MTIEQLQRRVVIATNQTFDPRLLTKIVCTVASELGFSVDEASGELVKKPAAAVSDMRQRNVRAFQRGRR